MGTRGVLAMVVAAAMTVNGAGRVAASVDAAGGRSPAQVALTARAQPAAATAALRILVVAGEDAVNIIQQKTAVAPIVEVRDRNDLPVAGLLVRFSVGGGRATFGGQPVLSVTTNAAGRATVTGLTPTTSGTFQINVSAAYQGQTATATITQTNFATAAQAAEAGKAGSGSGGAGSAAAGAAGGAAVGAAAASGGGGGMSATTIGLIGAGAAGGIFAVAKVAGGGGGGSSTASTAGGGGTAGGGTGGGGTGGGGTTPQTVTVSGPFTLQHPLSWTYVGGIGSCTIARTLTGTIRMNLQTQSSGAVTGTMDMAATSTTAGLTCSFQGGSFPGSGGSGAGSITGPVTGTTASLAFSQSTSISDPTFSYISTLAFAGALSNGVVTGTLSDNEVWTVPGVVTSMNGSGSTAVTLR